MQIQQIIKTSMGALTKNITRTILTMLGVIIGVFSVVALIAAVKGFENFVKDQFDAIGTDILYIMPGKMTFTDDPYKALSSNKFESKHVDLIKEYAGEYIDKITGYYRLAKEAQYKTNETTIFIEGMNQDAASVFDLEISQGEFYSEKEVLNKNRVAVLADSIADDLFTNKSPIGEDIKIDGLSYKVIGVFDVEIPDFRNSVFIPITVVEDNFNMENLQGIVLGVKSGKDIDQAMTAVELALLHDLKSEDFTVLSQTDMLEAFQNILNIITIGLAAIAGISLLVGGIGIMNIMLVSVSERTREIGLRKAIGATSFNIGQQFVLESITISLTGGLIGLLLAWIATRFAQSLIRVEIPIWAVLLAISFSVFVGVGFGTYPAIKASRKDPIEALRFE